MDKTPEIIGSHFEVDEKNEIFENQTTLALEALEAAMGQHTFESDDFYEIVKEHKNLLELNPQHIHNGPFRALLENYAIDLLKSGHFNASAAWARCAYIVGRRFAHGWFAYLNSIIAAGIFPSVSFATIDSNSVDQTEINIPRRIMQFWDSPNPPSDVAALMDRTKTKSVDWLYERYTEQEATNFIGQYFGERVLSAFNRLSHVAAKSDLFRYCYIYQMGGVYLDADEYCDEDFTQLISPALSFLLTWTPDKVPCINTWFIASERGNRLIKNAIDLCVIQVEGGIEKNLKLNAWVLTGPGVLTMVLLDDIAKNGIPISSNNLCLMEASEYRKKFHSEEHLEYRSDPKSNWRLQDLSS